LASTTRTRASSLPVTPTKVAGHATPFSVVPNFAVFIDTHRDQPHVQTFESDIHRGMARPTMVHYIPPPAGAPPGDLGQLMRVDDGMVIEVDPKHRFVEVEWWSEYVSEFVMDHGVSPLSTSGDTEGQLPTSHLRNARSKVYKLKSLRQIVRAWEKASVTAPGTLKPPSAAAKAAAKRAAKASAALASTPVVASAAAKSSLAAALAALGVPAPAAAKKREPYKGPKVTDHEFQSSSDDGLCWKPIKTRDGVSVCAVPKEGHA